MPFTCHHLLHFFLVLLLPPIQLAAPMMSPALPPTADANATAHHLLTLFGLPEGLLPGNVVSYTKSEEGDFAVELTQPCYVRFTDLVYYDKAITGRITYGRISRLDGVQVRKFFFWLDVTRVAARKEDGGSVVISAGFLSEKHPVSEFLEVRSCEKRVAAAAAAAAPSYPSSVLQSGGPEGVAAA